MVELLRKVEIFSALNNAELSELAGYCGYNCFSAGESIFKEGSSSLGFFIVKSGEVSITKSLDNNPPKEIARFIKGESFGEMDLIENSPRSANAIAELECEILKFPKDGIAFEDILKEKPSLSAKMMKEIISLIAGRIRSTNKLISEKTPWLRDLKRQLMTDKLTGLYNRTYLDEDYVARIDEYGKSSALLMVKPDNFKYINDTFGHETGDMVLVRMANTFKNLMKDRYEAVRYRGNELSAIIPEIDEPGAFEAADSLKSALDLMFIGDLTQEKKNNLTFSIGIAVYPSDSASGAGIILKSYERLYRCIEEGGNCIIMRDK